MKDRNILITGGSGSLGKALIPELLKGNPKAIRILSNSENAIYHIKEDMPDNRLRYLLGDVRDIDRLKRAMNGVDYVIHAAALKHVDLCEYNPIDTVKTNILGSINVIEAAIDCGVEKVLAISSDKAVQPVSIYGASKLVMEKLFINAGVYGKTKFSCVRFGNFKGSRGSFLEKIQNEDTIPITDVKMYRYWIELEDAARFTIKCLAMMKGKEIFIPKMEGKNIMEFIGDRPFEIIGRRPGEKIEEKLFTECESPADYGDYLVVRDYGDISR